MCVHFIHKWQDLLFKVDSERQIFFLWKTFHGKFYSISEFLPVICREEIAEKILFVFHLPEICREESAEEILFVFSSIAWPGARTLSGVFPSAAIISSSKLKTYFCMYYCRTVAFCLFYLSKFKWRFMLERMFYKFYCFWYLLKACIILYKRTYIAKKNCIFWKLVTLSISFLLMFFTK